MAENGTAENGKPEEAPPPRGIGAWPLAVRIALGAVVLLFVWSPFLAMVLRLGQRDQPPPPLPARPFERQAPSP
jgi:hypothetical protein